jgi:hypothetical protein
MSILLLKKRSILNIIDVHYEIATKIRDWNPESNSPEILKELYDKADAISIFDSYCDLEYAITHFSNLGKIFLIANLNDIAVVKAFR